MYMIFDSETTTKEAFRRTANPWHEDNWIVAHGWKFEGDQYCSWKYYNEKQRQGRYIRIPANVTLLVGHNIKFDLLWEMVMENPDLRAFLKRGGKIWCTQYVEYLLGAQVQEVQYAALNDVAPKYGGTTKIDAVKAMWEQGINTPDIPEDLLIDYLVGTEEENRDGGDIGNTEKIYLGQRAAVEAKGMTLMVEDRMDGLLATTEMEFRGLKVDVKEAGRRLGELNAELAKAEADLAAYIPADLPFEFNWNSPIHSSALIFGGTAKYEKPAHYIDDKTGQLARKQDEETHLLFSANGNTVAVPPARCTGYDEGRMLHYLDHAGGRLWQDTFAGGAKKGTGKTRKVKVPGELKTRITEFHYTFPGHTKAKEEWATSRNDALGAPVYSTSSEVMEALGKRNVPFTKALSKKMKLDKEIGTYYYKVDKKGKASGLLISVQPDDHMLHHNLNHTSTVTTRLSSSGSGGNLQNLPRKDEDAKTGEQKSQVKKMFISRFTEEYCKAHGLPWYGAGKTGKKVEADYSQLEVVVQGVLSKDPNLCADLRAKIDFHCKRVSAKHGITYDDAVAWCKNGVSMPALEAKGLTGKVERTKCKIFSFQRAYGAGADTIAEETGMSVEEVKELMRLEDEMYPGVVYFNKEVEAACHNSARPFQAMKDDGSWGTFRRGYWQAPTGTLYSWRTYEAQGWQKKRGINDSFNPPEMKNYPTQGTGGEFVQTILGLLIRRFIETDFYGGKAYLVNTVHDCVWVDAHIDVLDQVCADIKRIMESIPEYYNNRYNLGITVPFPVEVEFGDNMNDLSHWHPANDNHKELAHVA
ncbi:DNA polymerase I protein [Rhizobium phage RHph_Y1_20]|uniref:DNA polymerase I protein n=1 Tax=Rhizobium phage RHph_Y1_20 TaxID=2509571 RepID=A0A7S5USK6_9CAUD|nr:DNA polymerase I protein [Rhizobium phage RHph_Y1_20]